MGPRLGASTFFGATLLCQLACGETASKPEKRDDDAESRPKSSASARTTSSSLGSATASAAPSAAPPVVAAKPFVPAHEVPPFKGKLPHRDHPLGSYANRVVELKLARPSKEPDVAPMFSLKNLTDKPIDVGQTWLFYYDAEKKKSDRYPHSLGFTVKLGPGESKEHRLGQPADKLEPGLTLFEGEVTSALVEGKEWENNNLNPMPRPAGGVDAQTLADSAGERLVIDVYELSSYRIRVTNVTDRAIKDATLVLHYRDAKSSNVSVNARLPEKMDPIAPGASLDVTAAAWSDDRKSPPQATDVVAYADRVTFESGPKFWNQNLSEDVDWKVLGER